jgi:hypothetical protein
MPKILPQDVKDRAVESYLSGETLESSARLHGCSATACRKELQKRGISCRDASTAHRLVWGVDRDKIVEVYSNGASIKDTASLCNCSEWTCLSVLRENNIELRNHFTSQEELDGMVELYLSGRSGREAAAEFGYTSSVCLNELKDRGIKARSQGVYKPESYSYTDQMVYAYVGGMTAKDAGALFGYSSAICYSALKRRGIAVRKQEEYGRTRDVDHEFFSSIDNECKAYWLGFITADGCLHGNKVSIGLAAVDETHLNKYNKNLMSTYPVTYSRSNSSVRVSLTSEQIVKDLKSLGLSERKTFTVAPCSTVPDELMRHYWRGVIDGDGCIGKSAVKKTGYITWSVSLTGNKYMVEGFCRWVGDVTGIKMIPHTYKKDSYTAHCGGNKQVRRLLPHLYKDATMYLDRKYDRAMAALSQG